MAEPRNAVVVGAGIGGLAAASALHTDGWRVRVLERADDVRPLGAGLALWKNALVALDVLAPELAERVRHRPTISGQAGLRTPDGRWLLRLDHDQTAQRIEDLPVMVERPELYAGLRAGVSDGAFRFGRTATNVDQDAEHAVVVAETSNGIERYEADLVVAADGIASRLRPYVDDRPRPTAAGYLAWRGIVPADRAPDVDSGGETWGRGQRFGFSLLSDGGVYWYATLATADPRAGDPRLPELFADWHHPIGELIARTPAERLLRHEVTMVWPLPRTYVSGRLVLLGDAAHAMTPDLGQGACQALEDAVELATVVRNGTELRRYDELRRPRTTKLAKQARAIGRFGQLRNPLAAGLRDQVMRLVPARAAMRGLDDVLAWRPGSG